MHILCIQYLLLSCRDKGGTGYQDVAMPDVAIATEMGLAMTSAVITASSEHILIHHSQEVSSLGTQAHQLSSYSDSKMPYTGLVICCQSNFHFRDPCDFFSFHC